MKGIVFFLLLLASVRIEASALDVSAVQRAIREHGAAWTAAPNEFTALDAEERRRRLGLSGSPLTGAKPSLLSLSRLDFMPSFFDWRRADGNWVTPVRDQGSCGSCWAFSAVAQVEAWWNIRNRTIDPNLDLSEQILLSCSDAGDCENGGRVDLSLDFIRDVGVPPEKSLPYAAKSTVPCTDAAPKWNQETVKIPDWGYVTFGEAQVENIKTALLYHPVSAAFEVFSDFYAYKRGIYEHVYGKSEGWHAVLIVGWDDADRCWIVKNSWGPAWGENGYFRIRWGEVHFGEAVECIWDELSTAYVSLSTGQLSAAIEYGRVDTLEFTVKNIGTAPLQFYCIEAFSQTDESDWLTVIDGAGLVPAGGTARVRVIFDAKAVLPGNYERYLRISGNSRNLNDYVTCRLSVRPPQWDARLLKILTPPAGFPLLAEAPIRAAIENIGLNDLHAVSAVCRIFNKQALLYSDTVSISLPAASPAAICSFRPFRATAAEPLRLTAHLFGANGDLNRFNDTLSCAVRATNLLDDFEAESGLWDMRGGWGITSLLNGRTGSGAVHVNGGAYPYPPNMNSVLTFAPGFDLSGIDTLMVTFWVRVFTADAGDRCYVEISSDSLHWRTVDLLQGLQPPWCRRIIDFSNFLLERSTKAWFRFRFVSDETGGSIGVLIDEVQVFTGLVAPEETASSVLSAEKEPRDFALSAFPNPFNNVVTISYSLPEAGGAALTILDPRGRIVYRSQDELFWHGNTTFTWNAEGMPSGVYLAIVEIRYPDNRRQFKSQKILLLK